MAKKTTKKTKVKQKTSVSQQVNVYVTKRGGGGVKRPPQPSQAQQLLQTLAPLLAQRQGLPSGERQPAQPIVQSAQPLLSSQQQLEQLINVLGNRPSPNIIVNAPQGERGERGERGEPGPAGRQGARGFPAPMNQPEVSLEDIRKSMRDFVPPSERSGVSSWETPTIESLSPRSLPSFAFDFENASMRSGQSYALDLPDEPLVQPAQPAVSGAPIRLDNPQADVPAEYVAEEKQEAKTKQDYALEYSTPEKVNALSRDQIRKLAENLGISTHTTNPKKQRVWKTVPMFRNEINQTIARLLGLPK